MFKAVVNSVLLTEWRLIFAFSQFWKHVKAYDACPILFASLLPPCVLNWLLSWRQPVAGIFTEAARLLCCSSSMFALVSSMLVASCLLLCYAVVVSYDIMISRNVFILYTRWALLLWLSAPITIIFWSVVQNGRIVVYAVMIFNIWPAALCLQSHHNCADIQSKNTSSLCSYIHTDYIVYFINITL